MPQDPRSGYVAAVLESVTLLGRALAAERRVPFHGRSLTRTQMQTLYFLAHDRHFVTPKRLAATLGVTAGAVTQLVDGLREEHLVEIASNPQDARSRIIRLTAGAATEIGEFERGTVERLLPLFNALSEDELQNLAKALTTITEES